MLTVAGFCVSHRFGGGGPCRFVRGAKQQPAGAARRGDDDGLAYCTLHNAQAGQGRSLSGRRLLYGARAKAGIQRDGGMATSPKSSGPC